MPSTTSLAAPHFQVRISTVLLGAALACLVVAFPLNWYSERHAQSPADFAVTILAFGVFPIAAISGCFSALVLLLWRRRWQFLIESVIGAALVYWLSHWEWL